MPLRASIPSDLAVPVYRRLLPLLEATRFKDEPAKLVPDLDGYADALRMVHDTTAADSVTARAAALR